jgi:hypothetical protein
MKNKKDKSIDKEMFGNVFNDLMRDEKSLEFSSKKNTSNKKKNVPNLGKVGLEKETNIISDLGKKLIQNEQKLFEMSIAFKELMKENERLKADNDNLRKGKIPLEVINSECPNCKTKEAEYEKLKEYTKELQECIKDNGFILLKDIPFENENYNIVGKKNKKEARINEDKSISICKDNLPKEIDINVIEKRVEEMNYLTYKEGNSKFEKDNNEGIYKLKQIKELKMVFYKNGVLIENYKFYEYVSQEGKQILNDIIDGYIPFIFLKDYPDGVPLKVVKNLNENFSEKEENKKSGDMNKVNYKKDKLSKEEFLNMLPKTVVREGEVINLRENFERFFVVKNDNDKYYNEKDNEYFLTDLNKIETNNICKLKIQIGILDKIVTLNIHKNEKIKKVFEFIVSLVNSLSSIKIKMIDTYALCTTYPFKQFLLNENKDMTELGFFPSQFLIFKQNN